MDTHENQCGGGLNIVSVGDTDLIDIFNEIQGQIDIGLIGKTGVSSQSVIAYMSSPGYAQILAVKQYLSSLLIDSVYNESLLSEILTMYGYSSMRDYQRDYTNTIEQISSLKSTSIGLKAINDLSGSIVLPIAVWQKEVAEFEFATDAAAYSTIVYYTLSSNSFYMSTMYKYSTALAEYIHVSTLEQGSTSILTQEYNDIIGAYWQTLQDMIGKRWFNMNNSAEAEEYSLLFQSMNQTGGGSVIDILAAYSSIQLSDAILYNISADDYFSRLHSTFSTNLKDYRDGLSSYIHCDYSTIVSTYVENIMQYKDEIIQCTTGELQNKASTMIGYSTLWLSALQGDSIAYENYEISTSTYTYYTGIINDLSTYIGQLSTMYKSTLFSFETWERICSTNRTLLTFLQLERAEVNATSLLASTNTLKTDLEDLINLLQQSPTANIDARFNYAEGAFQSLQQGGASLNDVQNMLNTINVMYNNNSTILASTTQSRAAAELPPDTTTIYANALSTQIGICDERIALATEKYDKELISSTYLTQEISSLNGYLSSYILTSSITDAQVSSTYSSLYGEYTSTVNGFIQEKISKQYQISKCIDSIILSTATVDTAYNSIEQIMLRLQELGYVFTDGQSGGQLIESSEELKFSEHALSRAENYIRSISGKTLTYSESAGLCGMAATEVSTATKNYRIIQKSIDDIRNAANPNNIVSDTYLTVRNAVQNLNDNASNYYMLSKIIYGYSYSTSYFKYSNYLNCLRILSSQMTTNLLENRDEITKIQWISSQKNTSVFSYGMNRVTDTISTYVSSSTGSVVAIANFNSKVQTLSTNSQNIREYRTILQSFINHIEGEQFSRNYYLICKRTFEDQEYYRLKQGYKPADIMSAYDFDQLMTAYDVSIQNVNRYIGGRKTMYTPFINATNRVLNHLRPGVVYSLKSVQNPVMPAPSYSITSSLLMDFTPVQPRILFPKGGVPTTTLIDCVPPADSDQSPFRTTTYPAAPTTTLDSVTHGIKGRYINISKPNNGSFEILQVLVIDATGKNVAFGKPVSGTSTASNPLFSAIVNGQYSADVPANFAPYFKYNLDPATVLQIDLGATYDITCIRYIKSAASSYDSRGLTFDIRGSNTGSLKTATLVANTPIEDCDFRIDPEARKYINPSRKGVCGYMGRYITLSKPDGQPFTLSQVAVVSSNGNNPAATRAVKINNGAATTSPVTDGTYYSRPRTSCVNASKLELDLGNEMEVIAVHLYGVSDGDQNTEGIVANLHTEDKLLAYVQTASTNNRKQVLDFRYIDPTFMNQACKTDLLWPPYYGVAGIICRYIRIIKQAGTGRLGFTKIKVVDKSGRDVALFKPVTASSEAVLDSRFNGVNDKNESGDLSESYSSASGDAEPIYEIDLERPFEICAITVFRCSDAVAFMDNVQIQIFGNDRTGAPTTQFSTPSGNGTIFYDIRYDPDEHGSSYPTDSVSTSKSYATFGTLALTVEISAYVSTMEITEGTGQSLLGSNVEKTIIYPSPSTTTIRFNNLREVNSVIVNSLPLGTRIILRDCDGYIVNNKTVQNFSTFTGVHRLADFRNPFQPPSIRNTAPMLPIPFKTLGAGWTDTNGTYAGIATPNGVAARYVKVSPRDGNSFLYISQIIVIDSRGINVAFQKDTFTTDTAAISATSRVVDGVYEPKLDATIPTVLSYENYICRNEANAFVSRQNGAYWVVDLGEEYLINSVIYVGVEGRYVDSVNTIIELFDASLKQVAVQVVSTYTTIFGVDILDFRVNRNKSAYTPGNYLEVRPRQIAIGCSGCGLMAQYVRLKGVNVRISQIIAIDSTGKNQALYMPTYTDSNLADSYRLVDGKYYQKMENPIQGEREAYIMNGSGYIEVNFGQEVEIVAIFLIPTVESTNLSNSVIIGPATVISSLPSNTNLTIQIYNKFRDTIATLNPTYNTRNFSDISLLNENNSVVYPSATKIIGVNIIKKFADFKIQAGLMSADVLTGDELPPLNFGCSTAPSSAPCAQELRVIPRFTRGTNGGIPTRYLRVYNVSQYVQISQIMAYGADGTNYAYQKKATSESIFPGTYAAKVTDGTGGYYHNARTCAESYKSEGNLYGFLEIDLWTKNSGEQVSSTNFEIVGLRCIFPSDNPGQNIGTRIHLLDENLLVLAQYVVGNGISLYNSSKYEFEELIVDYRLQPVATPINKIIMPKIATLTGIVSTTKSPNGIVEVDGKVYVADTLANRILVNDGTVFSSSNLLSYPIGLASDGTNIYVASYGNGTIVKIPIGSPGSAFVLCSIPKPYGLCLNEGTLYITTYDNAVTQYYTSQIDTGVSFTTIAGTGTWGFSELAGDAKLSDIKNSRGVAVDSDGNVYFSDTNNHRIRKLTPISGGGGYTIRTIAGRAGTAGYTLAEDGGAATSARLNSPTGVAVDSAGNVYFSDTNNYRIRKLTPNSTGGEYTITSIAGRLSGGTPVMGYSSAEDGGPALSAKLYDPFGIAIDSARNLYIADNQRIRKLTLNPGVGGYTIITIAGMSIVGGFSENPGDATLSRLNNPRGVAVDSDRNVYFADNYNHRIRKLTLNSGGGYTIRTIAGMSIVGGFSENPGDATLSR